MNKKRISVYTFNIDNKENIYMSNDTEMLLKECDSGVKMGLSSFNDILEYIKDSNLKTLILDSKFKHENLHNEIEKLLIKYHLYGKDPSPLIKGSSWIKTKFELLMNDDDKAIASLMVDGSNMGVKTLSQRLNKHKNASEDVKNITKKIIDIESEFSINLRQFL